MAFVFPANNKIATGADLSAELLRTGKGYRVPEWDSNQKLMTYSEITLGVNNAVPALGGVLNMYVVVSISRTYAPNQCVMCKDIFFDLKSVILPPVTDSSSSWNSL